VTWTKSFACPDGVGEDAVKMLEDAIERRGVSNYLLIHGVFWVIYHQRPVSLGLYHDCHKP